MLINSILIDFFLQKHYFSILHYLTYFEICNVSVIFFAQKRVRVFPLPIASSIVMLEWKAVLIKLHIKINLNMLRYSDKQHMNHE